MRTTVVNLALATSILSLTGCTMIPSRHFDIVDREALHLDTGDVYSVFISPPNRSMDRGPGTNTSYLTLIDEQGHIRAIRTSPMDRGTPLWNSSGLYMSDRDQDFSLTPQMQVSKNKKPELLESTGFSDDGQSILSLYNEGWEDDGHYSMIAEFRSSSTFARGRADGLYFTNSICGDAMYGVGESFAEGHDPEVGSPIAFSTVVEKDQTNEKIIKTYAPDDDVSEGGLLQSPCHENTIYTLADFPETDARDHHGTARTWNVETGQRSDARLVAEDGSRFPLPTLDYLDRSHYNKHTYADGRLQWLAPDSIMWETDMSTDRTHRLYSIDVDTDMGSDGDTSFDISPHHIFVLASKGSKSTIKTFSRTDGHLESELKIPGLGRLTGEYRWAQGFAYNPAIG
ncbi:hypothetical protein NQ038_04345 [Brevibacterium sp. 50QC2O2]|uniref:hypothetical protein n=1 Tax=Brevibacterium TaxID=1696 RepID=UPI00211BCC91|nr:MULTISPECIES: hypothetical protein [unclassified Brevibacterium]MCQ9367441.1 hypothetical protein [Brevibacterium sp. 91QC2O2]MCQ9384545.1 hypothetical protein [Brevibacterium sp. 68QC2CO]MCQ9387874.1 hypothetical protein [Brevibacterium sp. 50QC2O2]